MNDAYLSSVQKALDDATRPLREEYERITKVIEDRETELTELRDARTKIRRLIAAVEPGFGRNGTKPGPKPRSKSGGGKKVGLPLVDRTAEWLRENADEFNNLSDEGFWVTEIARRPDAPASQSSLAQVMMQLHRRGDIRLMNMSGVGGRKHYKVIV